MAGHRAHARQRLLAELRRQGSVHVAGASVVSRTKARTILRDGTVHGRALTPAQRRLFGLIAGGGTPTRLRSR